jgi:Ser/Thr protein kinase RdoA (MazF antagonist)
MDDAVLKWVLEVAAPGAEVVEVRGLRDGGSPWSVSFRSVPSGVTGSVVVRTVRADDQVLVDIETAALRALADRHSSVPFPRLLAAAPPDLAATTGPALIIERLPGSSRIPSTAPVARLRRLGALVAELQAVTPTGLHRRERSICGIDFASLRRAAPARPLLVEAEAAVAARSVPGPFTGLVHGDLWQGNTLWDGDGLTGVIDWDCAGVGPAGIDLGSLRNDAAMCYGVGAAAEVLYGYETAAGHPAADLPYWDAVAALCTPPDMSWFVEATRGQGRTDLARDVMVDRRDEFLRAALARLS